MLGKVKLKRGSGSANSSAAYCHPGQIDAHGNSLSPRAAPWTIRIATMAPIPLLKPERVFSCHPSNGTARRQHPSAGSSYPGDTPSVIGKKPWHRELACEVYTVS